jgi:hypothetical protein
LVQNATGELLLVRKGGTEVAIVHRELIITLAARYRLPAVYFLPFLRHRGRLDFIRT